MLRRIFVDANVLIAGADSRSGASNAVLKLAEMRLIQFVVSRQVLDEAERNLRKKLPRALPNFATQMAQLNLEIVPDPPKEEVEWCESIIEAKDAPILAAAIHVRPDRLLTLNTRDFTPAVVSASGLAVQTPAEFVQHVRMLLTEGLTTL